MSNKLSTIYSLLLVADIVVTSLLGLRACRRIGSRSIVASTVIYLLMAVVVFVEFRRDPRRSTYGVFVALGACYALALMELMDRLHP